jgi:hypothetical protein
MLHGDSRNMANLDYVWQKLSQAVSSMASDDRTLIERLARVYPSVQTLTAADFPAELLSAFHKVDILRRKADAITGRAPEGKIKAALDSMTERQVRDLIAALCALNDQVARRHPI